jgi:copper chaperone CopZ
MTELPESYTARYVVTGMTCAHCVASVTEEVQELPGVEQVEVSLEDGTLRVTSSRPLDEAAVRGAVEEAGYALSPTAT